MIPIATIVGTLNKLAGTAESIAKKSEQGQLIDAGEARGLAKSLGEVNAALEEFRASRDRFDSDPDFRKWVFDE